MKAQKDYPELQRIADVILIELDPAYKKLKIGFGESFYFHNQKLWFNSSPASDPKLVDIRNVSCIEGELKFEVRSREGWQSLSVMSPYKASEIIIGLIVNLYNSNILLDTGFKDEIYMLLDANGFTLRLINTEANKRIILTLSDQYGNTLVQRFPEPSTRRPIHSVEITENILTIKCTPGEEDKNLPPSESDLIYKWEMDIQPEILVPVTKLIASIVSGYPQ